jgi:hypothetical protein
MKRSSRHRGRSLARRLAALPAVLLLLGATGFVLREGLAEWHAIQANQRIAQWETGRPLAAMSAWEIEQDIRRAIALSPRNGDHRESLGTLFFARAIQEGRPPGEMMQDLDTAVLHYREATQRTTVSGYAWGNLMIAKHYAGQIDPEFYTALNNAVRFAPLEAPVQLMVLGAVLPRWDQVRGEARALAAETVQRGWADHRQAIVAQARFTPNRDLWCGPVWLTADDEQRAAMRRLCEAVAEPISPLGPGARPAP